MSALINKIVYIFDSPVGQNLPLIRTEEINILDCLYRVRTARGDGNPCAGCESLIHQNRALRRLIHCKRQSAVCSAKFSVCLEYLFPVLIIPVFIKQGYNAPGSNLCNIILMGLRRKLRVKDSFVIHAAEPAEVFSFFL